MVFDKIENAGLYENMHPGIKKAFEYLRNTDLKNIALGKYPIEGEDIFALIMEYETKDPEDAKLEGHKKYIDVQLMVRGNEKCGITFYHDQKPIDPFDIERDVWFFNEPVDIMPFNEGNFYIFFPHDLHQPAIKYPEKETIRKAVIKVKV